MYFYCEGKMRIIELGDLAVKYARLRTGIENSLLMISPEIRLYNFEGLFRNANKIHILIHLYNLHCLENNMIQVGMRHDLLSKLISNLFKVSNRYIRIVWDHCYYSP